MSSQKQERMVDRKLLNVCIFIRDNFDKLQREIANILKILSVAESYSMAYKEKNMAIMHFKASVSECDNKTLKVLFDDLENISKGLGHEFFQKIDFINIYKVMCDKLLKSDGTIYVWKAKKALGYIIYEMDRIINCNDTNKKIAVLKGMMAYY